jgi:hypothetical protein
MMRTVAILLALGFGVVQSLWLTDCCCGAFCTQKDSTAPCGAAPAPAHADASCCEPSPAPARESDCPGRCSHIEPLSDVAPVAPDVAAAAPAPHALDAVEPPVVGADDATRTPHLTDGSPPRAQDRPLHLLLAVLRR